MSDAIQRAIDLLHVLSPSAIEGSAFRSEIEGTIKSLKAERARQDARECSECGDNRQGLSLYCVKCLNHDGWHLVTDEDKARQDGMVVPDAMPIRPFTTVDLSSKNYAAGWNACRRAMITAAKEQGQ